MKTLINIFIAALLIITVTAGAQTEIKALKVGDTVPEIILKSLVNHDQPVKLSSLHQQDLLIVDFWATWCSGCLQEMPVLDSLVKANAGKLSALTVAYEPKALITAFLKRRSDLKTSHLVMVTDDKILSEYFQHRQIPHNVWINKYGVIKYITGSEDVNQKNITAFFTNAKLEEHEKNDILNFDGFNPFHLRDSNYNYRSIETSYVPGIFTGDDCQGVWHHPTENWVSRVFCFNNSIQQLLWTAVGRQVSSQDYYATMKIITKDSLRFFFPEQCKETFKKSKYGSREDWIRSNEYCYELTLPNAVKDTVFYPYILNDLERIFKVNVSVENQRMPVCVLSLEKGKTFAVPTNDSTYINITHDSLQAHNVTLIHLCEYLNFLVKPNLNAKPLDPPYKDETGINSRIDIDIKFNEKVDTYAEIQKYITNKYGIHFDVQNRDYPVTIITDLAP